MNKLQLLILKWWKLGCLVLLANLFAAASFAQTIAVKGRVLDEKGEPLTGATIKVTGTSNAVTADANGNFTLNVPTGTNSVTISFIGYVDVVKNVTATGANLGSITMTANSRDLNEVVVVGYGTLRRQDVTGTVATIDNKVLQEIPSSNVFEQMKGRIAGLDVVNGSNGPAITIRGNRTIGNPGADGPLIVLDGVPYYNSIENINPNDIKSVDVLKGASATAIYGSRGSGGVILVTTFRGRVGKSQTSYDSYVGISSLMGDLKVLDATGYQQLKKDAVEGAQIQGYGGNQAYPLTANELAAAAAGVSTNWMDLVANKNAVVWDQSLRVSSGTEKTQFNVGVAYRLNTNNNLQPNNDTKRITLNANIDHKINNIIKFGISTNTSVRLLNNSGGNEIGTAQWLTPLANPYNSDGSVNIRPFDGSLDGSTQSPLLRRNLPDAFYNYTRGFLSNNILYVEVKPINHFTYKYTVNYNFSQSLAGTYNGINGAGIVDVSRTNASTTNNYTYRLAQEHLLTYDNTFKKHRINFVAGFTSEKQHDENSNMSALGIPSNANKNANLNLGTFNTFGGNWSERGILSYFGRVNYVFNNRYDLTATFRGDGNSTLATGNQWTTYPSVGLGWNLTSEDFIKQYAFIDNLKLRAGYGENSTISGSTYQTLGQLQNLSYQFGGASAGDQQGVRITNLTNPNLTWQRTKDVNLALDFGVLKNRITGTFEVYSQKTTGIILSNQLPETIGANAQNSNLGSSSAKGLEITLSSVNIQSKGGFTWSTDFNIGFNRERIDALPNGSQRNIGSGLFVGQPLTVYYDLRKIGIWQISDSQGIDVTKTAALAGAGTAYLPVKGQTDPLQYPGMIRVEDVNKDGKINADDNQILGHVQPQYTFGFSNRFNYKNFDLSVVINGRMGFTTVVPYVSSSNSNAQGWQFLNLGRHNQPVLDYWTPRNPNGQWPMPNNQFQSQYYSTLQYFDGSWIKVRSINLGYTIPSNVLKNLGITSFRVYANVTNPFILYAPVRNHGFSVIDPESVSGVQPNVLSANGYVPNLNNNEGLRSSGINAGTQTRDFIFGINARF